MKKLILGTIICLFIYCGIYFLGQPIACKSELASRVWCTAFYPLRLIQFRDLYAGTETERGLISGSANAGWGLLFETPKIMPDGDSIGRMSFRVPARLAEKVYNARYYKKVEITVSKEPSPKYFNGADYVLTSIKVMP